MDTFLDVKGSNVQEGILGHRATVMLEEKPENCKLQLQNAAPVE